MHPFLSVYRPLPAKFACHLRTRSIEPLIVHANSLFDQFPYFITVELTFFELSKKNLLVHLLNRRNVVGVHLRTNGSHRSRSGPPTLSYQWLRELQSDTYNSYQVFMVFGSLLLHLLEKFPNTISSPNTSMSFDSHFSCIPRHPQSLRDLFNYVRRCPTIPLAEYVQEATMRPLGYFPDALLATSR